MAHQLSQVPADVHSYRQSGIPFYAVVTNTLTGKAEYIRVKPENMNEVLPASCAISRLLASIRRCTGCR